MCCCAAAPNIGVATLLDNLVHYMPSAAEVKPATATDADGNTHTSHYIAEPKHLEYRPYADALRLCGFDCFAGF